MSKNCEDILCGGMHGDVIPIELAVLPQWVGWLSVVGQGVRVHLPDGTRTKRLMPRSKPYKLPIEPRRGGAAASDRCETWSSLEDARAAVRNWLLSGIGFVFSDSDPYAGVDLDNCREPETGEITEWAWNIIRVLNSYTEVSPSGTGVHTIVRGELPAGKGNQISYGTGKIEMFSRARYFTFSSLHVEHTPTEIFDRQAELSALHQRLFAGRITQQAKCLGVAAPIVLTDEELILRAQRARNGRKFCQLWRGEWEGLYTSQSEAELALCCLLAFWTGKNPKQIDRLVRRSGLMRAKWLRQSYRQSTIAKAIAISGQGWRASYVHTILADPQGASDHVASNL